MEKSIINIYSDESNHINNGSTFMLLGAIWCSPEAAKTLSGKIKLAKLNHGISIHREIKWTKVSQAKIEYYKDLIDIFVDDDSLKYRAVIVDKNTLDHELFNQTEDDFYYKMQYYLVRNIAEKRFGPFKIYIDYKDAWSNKRCLELSRILSNTTTFMNKTFDAQPVASHQVSALQLADLITGAVMYANKPAGENQSLAKKGLVNYIEKRIGQKLTIETPPALEKFNLFFWEPRGSK